MTKGRRTFRSVLLGAVLALAPAAAWAQTTTPTPAQTTGTGAFAQLSPGEQKITQALFEAQTTGTGTTAPTPLTRDEIAAKRQGRGWGEVFKDMKAQGLLTQKNLGQVVSGYERRHPETRGTATRGMETGRARGETESGVVTGSGRSMTGRGRSSGAAGAAEDATGSGNGAGRGGRGMR